MMNTQEISDKISALKVFKDQINVAIRDEQEAQRIYNTMMTQARQARTSSGISDIQAIRDQERDHETKFKTMLRNTEKSITEFETQLKEEQRRKEEERQREQQRKKDEVQRLKEQRRR